MRRQTTDVSDGQQFSLQVLWGVEVVGSSSERSDNSVLRSVGGGGGVLRIEVGVGGFSVNLSGCIRTSRKGKDPSGEGCSMVKERSSVRKLSKVR